MAQRLVLLLLGLWLTALPAFAVEPFYQQRLRQGQQAMQRGQHAEAARQYRLACFGMLEEPPALAGCLAHLAWAQIAAGDRSGFDESLARLVDLEERFGAWSAADLDSEIRSGFENLLVERLSADRLSTLGPFAHLATRKAEQTLEALPPRQRRRELERRIDAAPGEPRWGLMLARLELAEGRETQAIAVLDRLLSAVPDQPDAVCLRGRTLAGEGECRRAIPDLGACTATPRDPSLAAALLRCYEESGDPAAARAFAASLPAATASHPSVAARIERLPEAPSAAAPQTPRTGHRGDGSGGPLSDHERATLEEARRIKDSATSPAELARALTLARSVAEERPASRPANLLAAEIAYRSSRWAEAVRFFERAGELEGEPPALLFYYAVALYEAGDADRAATVLERCLPDLQRTPFVEAYVERILGTS